MNKKWLLFLCIGSLILSLFVLKTDVIASGNKIFVSPTGIGAICSQDFPCRPAAGLNKAVDGDTLYFQQGTYTGISDPILNVTKGVSLIGGWNGWSTGMVIINPFKYETIIDGGDQRQLASIATDSDETVFITGFTFKNGKSGSYGGAIHVEQGGVIIESNRFENNSAGTSGGGIHVHYAGTDDILTIKNNLFKENSAKNGGGGICIIRHEAAPAARVERNEFIENTANHGGAIDVQKSAVIINANLIANTKASSAILVTNKQEAQITNNIIYWDDRPSDDSSAINGYYEERTIEVINNTIVNAYVGIKKLQNATMNVANNILYGCRESIRGDGNPNLTGTHNLFYNNTNDPLKLDNPVTDKDPLFVDAENGDYHIQEDSPAVDAGEVVALTVDFDGDKRPMGAGYDIGADEFRPSDFLLFLPLILR
ncbi:MAG: hypothetical protein GX142_00965 [Chloroflexi bacterium]|nr:hypothetical protein [Chloroflexota bacterium]